MIMTDRFAAKAAEWDTPSPRTVMAEKFVNEIKQMNLVNKEIHFVEFGCGTGLVGINFIAESKRVTFVDNSSAMLSILREKIDSIQAKNCNILEGSYPEMRLIEKADIIVALMSVHHVELIDEMAKAFRSILDKDGQLIIGDLRTEDGSFHGTESVPHNGFDEKSFTNLFQQSGFEIEKFYTFNTMQRTLEEQNQRDFEQFIMVAKAV